MENKNSAYYFLAFEEYVRDNPSAQVTDLEFQQWYANKKLYDLEQSFKDGDKPSLLHAIYMCASSGLPMPQWVASNYSKAWADIVVFAKHKSWDDVFGLPYKKGTHINAIKKELRLKSKVFSIVEKKIADDFSIDENLFDEVGKALGICKTLASQYYYAEKHRVAEFHEILKNNGNT